MASRLTGTEEPPKRTPSLPHPAALVPDVCAIGGEASATTPTGQAEGSIDCILSLG